MFYWPYSDATCKTVLPRSSLENTVTADGSWRFLLNSKNSWYCTYQWFWHIEWGKWVILYSLIISQLFMQFMTKRIFRFCRLITKNAVRREKSEQAHFLDFSPFLLSLQGKGRRGTLKGGWNLTSWQTRNKWQSLFFGLVPRLFINTFSHRLRKDERTKKNLKCRPNATHLTCNFSHLSQEQRGWHNSFSRATPGSDNNFPISSSFPLDANCKKQPKV